MAISNNKNIDVAQAFKQHSFTKQTNNCKPVDVPQALKYNKILFSEKKLAIFLYNRVIELLSDEII